jgi:hypothetical protein
MRPMTGVISIYDVRVRWLLEEVGNKGINIDYLRYIQERREELEGEGMPEEEIEDTLELECEEYDGGTMIIGYKLDEEGLYDIDPDVELSAIQREDVVQSPVEHGFDTYAPRPKDGEGEGGE